MNSHLPSVHISNIATLSCIDLLTSRDDQLATVQAMRPTLADLLNVLQAVSNATEDSRHEAARVGHVVFLWVTGLAALQRPFELENGVKLVAWVGKDRVG
jgi:hypothetical protein